MIVVVDFSLMYYRMLFGCKTAVIENTDYFAHLLMNGLLQNIRDFDIDRENRLIVAVDCKRSNNWRTKYYEENSKDFEEYNKPVRESYKGNRPKDNEIPWENIYEILEDFLETIKNYSDFQVIKHDRAEADDIIAITSKHYGKDKEVGIISTDKDFHQLLNKNVKLFDPIKRKKIIIDDSNQLLLEHILTGQQKKDNIYPVRKGMGPKTARKEMFKLKALFKLNPDMKKRFEFNRKLIDLDLIPEDISKEILEILETPQFNFNLNGLLDFCRKYSLRNHMENMVKLKLSDGKQTSLW